MVAEVGRKVMEICPNALFLNYTNPMTVLTRTLAMQGVKVVGLCHEWIGVREKLAFIFNSEPENITARIAGVNHLIWVTDPCRASVDASHGGALVQLRYHSIVA